MGGRLEGLTALVTGGTRGIGKAIAERFLKEGAHVIVTGASPGGEGPEGADYIGVEFQDRDAVSRFVEKVKGMDVDILVNNAGVNKIGPFDQIDPADYDRIQEINMRAPFLVSQAVIPYMKKKRWGRIINLTSIFGIVSKEFRAPYSVSKFGLNGMTAALAAEVASDGILVNCIAPGFIDTELTRRILGEDGIKKLVEQVPIRRLGKPEEIAAFAAWLAGPENTFISGQNIAIDGGFTRV